MAGFGCCTGRNKLGDEPETSHFGSKPKIDLAGLFLNTPLAGLFSDLESGGAISPGGGPGDSGRSGKNSGDSLAADGQDCYEVYIAFIKVETKHTGRPDPAHPDRAFPIGKLVSWKVGTPLVGMIVGWLGGGKPQATGHIVKICMCMSWSEAFLLSKMLWKKAGISYGIGRWVAGNDTYLYVDVKPSCLDHSGGFLGLLKTKKCGHGSKKCECADYKGVDLKNITEKTRVYKASNGGEIFVGPTLNYKGVIEDIVDHESRVLWLNCAKGNPDLIQINTKRKSEKHIN